MVEVLFSKKTLTVSDDGSLMFLFVDSVSRSNKTSLSSCTCILHGSKNICATNEGGTFANKFLIRWTYQAHNGTPKPWIERIVLHKADAEVHMFALSMELRSGYNWKTLPIVEELIQSC